MVENSGLELACPRPSALFRVIGAPSKNSAVLKEMTHMDMLVGI